jgi:hypothetical protein
LYNRIKKVANNVFSRFGHKQEQQKIGGGFFAVSGCCAIVS